MADNVPITPGSGKTIAADELTDATLGTVEVQFLKLMDGTLDSSNKAVVSSAGALKVDNSGVTQPVSGTFWQATQPVSGTITVTQSTAANLLATVSGTVAATQSGTWTARVVGNAGATFDSSAGQNQTMPTNMIMVGGQFNTTPTTIVSGNASPLQLDSGGNLKVNVAATITQLIQGDLAVGATDATSNNPVKVGGTGKTANPTAVTDGQRVAAVFDKQGKQVVVGAIRNLKAVQKTSITTTSETTVVTAGGAGVFCDVYAIVVTNKSATAVFVDFKDATAGTTRMTLSAPSNDTRGFTVPVDSAMVQAVANNNWTATVSAAVTSIEITVLYVNNL
jgi:hypothetical protein